MIKLEDIHETMYRNISDLDLKRYFPETGNPNDNVIKYNELSEINSLNEILPNEHRGSPKANCRFFSKKVEGHFLFCFWGFTFIIKNHFENNRYI